MANEIVEVKIALTDPGNSAKQRLKEAKELNTEHEKLRRVAAGLAPTRSAAAVRAESVDYGATRALGAGTGAGARDFANEAQGLGGLVRLYATYAANVFAVSAAFGALRDAMSTDMMVRGLNQLGTSSGIAMGGLAKQFALASDGAISLKEAMTATAQAVSSGLTQKQFLELGQVAKGASIALGRDMSDSVARLTRGIVKLEPELLDELGIFTKIGPATEAYAKSVGKTAAQLTDFERRQAFANAVLKEGKTKFGEIADAANPYDKLLASLKNVAQSTLSVVNSVIAPIANLLANNTGLIGAAIALMAVKITKQAIPALGQWQQGLAAAAATAAAKSSEINTKFGEAFVIRAQNRAKVPQLEQAIRETEQAMAQARKKFIEEDSSYKRPKQSTILAAFKDSRPLNEKELATASKEVAKYAKQTDESSKRHSESLANNIALQKQLVAQTLALSKANDQVQAAADKPSKFLSGEWQREQVVKNARQKAAGLALLAGSETNTGVAQKVQEIGLVGGMKSFYADVRASKDLDNLSKFKTAAVGTMIGVSQAVEILGSALSRAFAIFQVVVVAYGIMSAIFSKNSKEADAFSSSMDLLAESTKTANGVAEKYKNTLSTESINAVANAFTSLSDGIKDSNEQLRNVDKAASGFDKLVDGFKTVLGKDLRSAATTGLTESILGAVKLIPEGEIKNSLESKLKAATGAVTLSQEGLTKAFGKLDKEGFLNMGAQISAIFDASKKVLGNTQALTQDILETGKSVTESYSALSNSIKDNTPVTTFLGASIKQALALDKALQDATAAQVVLKDIAAGTIKPQFLTSDTALQIMPLAEEASKLSDQSKKYSDNLSTAKLREQEINEILKSRLLFNTERSKLNIEGSNLRKVIEESRTGLLDINKRIADITVQAQKLIKDSIVSQIDEGLKQTSLKIQQINIQSKLSAVSKLTTTTESSVKYTADLQRQSIETERLLFKSQEGLVRSIDLLAIQVQRDADLRQIAMIDADSSADQFMRKERTKLQMRVNTADDAVKAYNSKDLSALTAIAKENPAMMSLVASVQATQLNNAKFTAQLKEVNLNESIAAINLKYSDLIKNSETTLSSLDAKLAGITGSTAQAGMDKLAVQKQIQDEKIRQTELKSNQSIAVEAVAGRAAGSTKVTKEGIEKLQNERAIAVETLKRSDAVANLNAQLEIEQKLREQSNRLEKTNLEIATAAVVAAEELEKIIIPSKTEELSLARQLGNLNEDEYKSRDSALKLRSAEIEKTQKLRKATDEYTLAVAKLNEETSSPTSNRTADQTAADAAQIVQNKQIAVSGAETVYNQTVRSIELQNSMTSSQQKISDVFQKGFENMGDVFVEFAQTGKLSFKDMANSMIADIMRIIIKTQILKEVQKEGGIMSSINSFLGIGKSSAGGGVGETNGASISAADFDFGMAKGGGFDNGVLKFAKGGTFSNSVVDSPTLFKFAKGTGLMGEAGPEAIMPLKRDNNGSLGVVNHGGGGKVDVVVNNYSSEKATTKETVDSKGNRKIEVMVGDMVADQLGKAGSSAQQSLTSNYGQRPVMVRR